MSQWYYTSGGAQQGPVSTQELQSWVANGQLAPTELVWREGMGEWKPIAQIAELATSQPAYQAQQPYQAQGYQQPGAYQGGYQAPYGAAPGYQTPLGYATPTPYMGAPVPGAYYGGFWWRVLAYIIDSIVLWLPNFILQKALESAMGTVQLTPGGGIPPRFWSIMGMGMAAQIILAWLYYAGMESSVHQGTLGKKACGLVVTDEKGQRISFGRSTGRYFGKIISGLILGIGYIMVGIDNQKRGLHDMMAKTLVWKKP